MIRVRDLRIGDYFSCGPNDYLVTDICLIERDTKIQLIVTNIGSGLEGIKTIWALNEENNTWKFIARQAGYKDKQEKIQDEKTKIHEKRGWEPDIVEPFLNIRDTLG